MVDNNPMPDWLEFRINDHPLAVRRRTIIEVWPVDDKRSQLTIAAGTLQTRIVDGDYDTIMEHVKKGCDRC